MTDRLIIQNVINEWKSGAGMGVVVPTATGMLQKLEQAYGDNVTIDGACDALKRLSDEALSMRNRLRIEQKKRSRS